ncbi:MAG: hypothetical protein ABIE03_07430 [Patescibacteria group bacterium]
MPSELKGKIIYVLNGNIYIADKNGKNSKKLTAYPEVESMMSVQLISENLLGYFTCRYEEDLFNCEISTLDINSTKTTNLKKTNDVNCIDQVSFIDGNEYAYTRSEGPSKYVIYYVKDDQEEILKEWNEESYGRGIMLYDNSRLRFSPDGENLLHMSTISRSGMDFNVYVLDLEGKLLDTIHNATFPVWKTNGEILYVAYDQAGMVDDDKRGVFVRDIETQKSTKLQNAFPSAYVENSTVSYPFTGGYDLVYSENKLYCWGVFVEGLGFGHSYIYDFEKDEKELFDGGEVYPIPLSDNEVIFAKTESFGGGTDCSIPHSFSDLTSLKLVSYVYKYLETGKETKINLPEEAFSRGVITELNHYID